MLAEARLLGHRQKTLLFMAQKVAWVSYWFLSFPHGTQVTGVTWGARWMPRTQWVVVSGRSSDAGNLHFMVPGSLLFVLGEALSHRPRLLAACTTLKNSPGKEQSGPCILGTPSKTCRGLRDPWRDVPQHMVLGARGFFPIRSSFHRSDCHCYLNPVPFVQIQECALFAGSAWEWGKLCHYSFIFSTNSTKWRCSDLCDSLITVSSLSKIHLAGALGNTWKVFFY